MESRIYKIRDNGVRTFLPPCFCWELRELGGVVTDLVSEIEFAGALGGMEKESVLSLLAQGQRLVKGWTEASGIPETGMKPGKRLVVENILPLE